MAVLLDKNRDYGIMGCGSLKFYSQDNKLFDMGTLEEVDPTTIPQEKPKTPPVLTCKFCGAKRETPELMKEHLLALHKDDMEKDKAEKAIEAQKAKIDAGKQCSLCGAPKRADVKKGEWQFSCDCYNKLDKFGEEKPKENEMVTAGDVLHRERPKPKPIRKKRGRPRKVEK